MTDDYYGDPNPEPDPDLTIAEIRLRSYILADGTRGWSWAVSRDCDVAELSVLLMRGLLRTMGITQERRQ